jgi:hypothetical protein
MDRKEIYKDEINPAKKGAVATAPLILCIVLASLNVIL